jgi:hypothetical protein
MGVMTMGFAAGVSLLGFAAAASAASSRVAPSEVQVAEAAAQSFASKADAEAFLSDAVPAATAANPKYRTPGTDYERRWLTRKIEFSRGESGVIVSTDEVFEDTRNGAQISRGAHQAKFAIDDVAISLETTDDVAETGAKAQGVLFKCVGQPCIQAVWDGQPSISASTDIYIQEGRRRDQILAAFRALQGKADSR